MSSQQSAISASPAGSVQRQEDTEEEEPAVQGSFVQREEDDMEEAEG
jgi:hypothetical protein